MWREEVKLGAATLKRTKHHHQWWNEENTVHRLCVWAYEKFENFFFIGLKNVNFIIGKFCWRIYINWKWGEEYFTFFTFWWNEFDENIMKNNMRKLRIINGLNFPCHQQFFVHHFFFKRVNFETPWKTPSLLWSWSFSTIFVSLV